MRVGIIGPIDPDSFADNILDCLPDLGVDAVHLGTPRPAFRSGKVSAAYDFAARAFPAIDEKAQSKLVRKAIESEVNLVISTQSELMPSTVTAIKNAGIPAVLWYPDALTNMGRGLMFSADYSTLYLKDPDVVARTVALTKTNAKYLPEAFNPHWHVPAGTAQGGESGMVVAGNMYPTRVNLLDRLMEEQVPMRLYGNGFPSWIPKRPVMELYAKRSVFRQEKARTFRQATAVLNNLHPSEMASVNCRLFEATGSGAAVLTEYRDALPDLFDMGSEVLAFSRFDELMKHWNALVDDPELGTRIGDAAAKRALADHTYQHRLKVILTDNVA